MNTIGDLVIFHASVPHMSSELSGNKGSRGSRGGSCSSGNSGKTGNSDSGISIDIELAKELE